MIKRQLSKFLCVFQAFCIITAAIPAAAAEEVLIDQTSKAVQSLSISVPSFSQIFEGYQQPEAKPVILRNTGESYIYGKVNMSLSGDYFELTQPSGNIALAPGAETDSRNYTVAPKTGLAAGEYTSIITVTYSNEKIGEAVISFTVKPADEEWQEPDPNIPDAKAPQSLAELQNTNPSEVAKLPRFDSRNYGIVPPVKDQGSSNICWCYAPITASEISIHRSGIDTNANTENLRLSPEALARARHSRGADPLGNTKGENTGLDWYSSSGNIDYTPTLLSQ
ncbi:MAG: hypothetical protein HFG67_01700, partial [Firmicutes bacterium]|nr:hypothetical protein [Bacillota bacterium]